MIFPYWEAEQRGELRYLPLLPVAVLGPAGEVNVVALVPAAYRFSKPAPAA